ncbi:uncharacterized protein LOC119881585 [Canis lupus familiaris]|uniref:uncharacterized protein LOC119881585 n=1 Tax=Canis lupus familiaris TaxID=9615 RepID=UPI0018F7D0C7|nr:uncharacterized protein LOC119881585 [Canis lupus familiaris]
MIIEDVALTRRQSLRTAHCPDAARCSLLPHTELVHVHWSSREPAGRAEPEPQPERGGGGRSQERPPPLPEEPRGRHTRPPPPPALTRTHTRALEAGGPGPTGPPWTPPARGAETLRRCPALSSAPRRGAWAGEGERGPEAIGYWWLSAFLYTSVSGCVVRASMCACFMHVWAGEGSEYLLEPGAGLCACGAEPPPLQAECQEGAWGIKLDSRKRE